VTLSVAAILFPLPLLLLFPRLEARGTFYVMVQVLSLVPLAIQAVLSATARGRGLESVALVAAFPLAGMVWLVDHSNPRTQQTFFIAGFLTTAVVIAMIGGPWRREMRTTWRLVAGGRAE
jgi:hypothetical protein